MEVVIVDVLDQVAAVAVVMVEGVAMVEVGVMAEVEVEVEEGVVVEEAAKCTFQEVLDRQLNYACS